MSIRDCNVYLWLDDNTPFYVGIGGDKRLSQVKRNKWATNRRKQAESQGSFRQEVVLQGSRSACNETEKLLISAYGSVVNGGLLFNFTEGGDGGDTFSSASDSEKIRRRELSRLRGLNATAVKDPDGKSTEARRKSKLLHSVKDVDGKSVVAKRAGAAAAESRKNLIDEWGRSLVSLSSWMAKKQKVIKVTNLDTKEELIFPSARIAAKSLGLSQPALSRVARGERKRYKNYTAEYLTNGD